MTIRDAIDQLLTGETTDQAAAPDPATVMADNGYGDVPSELFGTALVHFSDTAPLAQADALAPVVTRVSPIPFEEADLAPFGESESSDLGVAGSDPYALFASAAPALTELDDLDDLDEIDLDTSDRASHDSEEGDMDEGDEGGLDDTDPTAMQENNEIMTGDADADFGSGIVDTGLFGDPESAEFEDADVYTNDDAMLDDLAPRFDASPSPTEAQDTIEEAGVDLFSVEFDETDEADEGIDPDDLDFSD